MDHLHDTPEGEVLSVPRLAAQVEALADRLRRDVRPMPQAVVRAAMDMLGAPWGSITVQEGDRFRSLVVSDDFAEDLDLVQYTVGSGPCLDAIRHDTTYLLPDLDSEPRWPAYTEAARRLGVRSILSQPLHLIDGERSLAGLNLYSDVPAAFAESVRSGQAAVLATFAAMGTSLALGRTHSEQLESALLTNRDIAMALGVLMGKHGIQRDVALNLLRLASQQANMRMAALAAEIISSGEIPLIRLKQA